MPKDIWSLLISFIFILIVALAAFYAGWVHPHNAQKEIIMKLLDTYQLDKRQAEKLLRELEDKETTCQKD